MKTQIKIFLLMLIGLVFASCAVNAQKVTLWTAPTVATRDTVVDSTVSVINTFNLISAPAGMAIQANVKKVSGTPAGITTLQYSVDGVKWFPKSAIGDTLTHTGITGTKEKYWEITGPIAPFWRTVSTGTGTMKITVKTYGHTKPKQ